MIAKRTSSVYHDQLPRSGMYGKRTLGDTFAATRITQVVVCDSQFKREFLIQAQLWISHQTLFACLHWILLSRIRRKPS